MELVSGQSFMIGGLLSNNRNNSVEKTPFLGNLPILGALFRSNGFRRNETELVIIVTPYLVKPVNAGQIALPTDGFRTPNDAQRLLLGQSSVGSVGEQRPRPTIAPPVTVAPGVSPIGSATLPRPVAPAPQQRAQVAVQPAQPAAQRQQTASATPGFSFK